MGGDGKQRKVLRGTLSDKVQEEAVPFTFPKSQHTVEEVCSSPLIHLDSLEDHLLQLLEENMLLVQSHM